MLSRDAILGADDLPGGTVQVPEWGGELRIASWSGVERGEWEEAWEKWKSAHGGSQRDFYAMLAVHVVVDAQGKRMFRNEDIPVLGKKSVRVLARIAREGYRLNGIGPEEETDLLKNSNAAASEESGSV